MGQDAQFVVSTVGGYEIRRVRSPEGWLFVLDDSYIGFFSQGEAEDWACEHPRMSAPGVAEVSRSQRPISSTPKGTSEALLPRRPYRYPRRCHPI
jgi:hypothetical protein